MAANGLSWQSFERAQRKLVSHHACVISDKRIHISKAGIRDLSLLCPEPWWNYNTHRNPQLKNCLSMALWYTFVLVSRSCAAFVNQNWISSGDLLQTELPDWSLLWNENKTEQLRIDFSGCRKKWVFSHGRFYSARLIFFCICLRQMNAVRDSHLRCLMPPDLWPAPAPASHLRTPWWLFWTLRWCHSSVSLCMTAKTLHVMFVTLWHWFEWVLLSHSEVDHGRAV